MAISVKDNDNTTPGSLNVEEVLHDSADAGVYVLDIDLTNLALGEVLVVKIQKNIESGGSDIPVWTVPFKGPAGADKVIQSPVINAPYGMKVGITQENGTLRAFKWVLSQLDA